MTNYLISSGLKEKFWLVSADMGYGHHRAIYPLRTLSAYGKILNANISPNSTLKEQWLWNELLGIYEFMSRAGSLPLIGGIISKMLDSLLYIPKFYPLKDRSNSTLQVKYLKLSIKRGLCRGIIEEIKSPIRPIITSFYVPAIAAEIAGYKQIYCIICDTDLSRVWVAENASKSNIIYLAPVTESAQRLHSYGVPEKNIIITGFPLPLELLGNRNLDVLKTNLSRRLQNLDPDGKFYSLYKHSVNAFIQYDERNVITKGRLAEAAWLGFLKARKYGTYNILDFLEKGTFVSSNDPLKR